MAYVGNETTNLDITVRAYYDRLALMTLQNNTVLYDLCEKKPLPGKSGKTIHFTRYTNFSEVTTHLTEGVPPTAIQLSATNVSAALVQDGYVTEISDLLDMTNITDNGKAAVERLAEQAGRSIDSFIRREIYNTSTNSAVPVSANVKTYFFNDATRGNLSVLPQASCSMTTSVIRYATTQLKSINAKPLVGEDFVMVVNPITAGRLRADSTWLNANQYSGVFAEKIFKGECGRIEGTRIVESTQIPFFASSTAGNVYVSSAEVSAYFSILLGKGAVGVTEMGGGLETYTVAGADKSDPLNQKTTYGWKITWTPKTLNASCAALVVTTD